MASPVLRDHGEAVPEKKNKILVRSPGCPLGLVARLPGWPRRPVARLGAARLRPVAFPLPSPTATVTVLLRLVFHLWFPTILGGS